ncbi:hypothetical protein BOTBODRAFT_272763 [Botryobasidium botryosum FD-172 SS1]|uniref:Mediator of RNA polymerase II transcription subunit 25 von Willebrand factor type A domain-containing protein n=1 Tax=Botryobasidium botryosum (strain FD-172 SS1) TaxID=930990 RepID=A0A067MVA4_BOTB1|nr:hypothetical protein BOTBODRAFT_272763 [Botryobasidium botryosum FD-172 SS1]
MSSPTQPQLTQETAVAFVVDSSLATLRQWPELFRSYIIYLLQTLQQQHPHSKLRLGFVTYGKADERPSPVLAKHFFTAPDNLMAELKKPASESKLSLGKTGNAGRHGMAVLEGLITALEMFDLLQSRSKTLRPRNPNVPSAPPTAPPICHLILVASHGPGLQSYARHNSLKAFDNVGWQNLPDEFRKRNVNFDLILTTPIPKLSELHAKIVETPDKPSSLVKDGHVVLYSGLKAGPVRMPCSK